MEYTQNDLNKKICDIHEHDPEVTNEETLKQFIRATEEEFGLGNAKLKCLTDEELTSYVDLLSDLWDK